MTQRGLIKGLAILAGIGLVGLAVLVSGYITACVPTPPLVAQPPKSMKLDLKGSKFNVGVWQYPAEPLVGELTYFTSMVNDAVTDTWLWHLDLYATMSKDEKSVVVYNGHGHGGLPEFAVAFPSEGIYTVKLNVRQQVGSPNYEARNHEDETLTFSVDVKVGKRSYGIGKTINIKASSWAFSPSSITVSKGDVVRLVVTTDNDEQPLYNTHGLRLDAYAINRNLPKGQTITIDFVADKTGTFTFGCSSFCSHGGTQHGDMLGNLLVR